MTDSASPTLRSVVPGRTYGLVASKIVARALVSADGVPVSKANRARNRTLERAAKRAGIEEPWLINLYLDEVGAAPLAAALRSAVGASPAVARVAVLVADVEGRVIWVGVPESLARRLDTIGRKAASFTLGPVLASPPTAERVIVDVYFGTDRDRLPGPKRFGTQSAGLSLGRAVVSLPRVRPLGTIARPKLWKLELREDPAKHVVITACSVLAPGTFVQELRGAYTSACDALLFIHGYNVAFDAAIMRAAQLKWDLQFQGPALAYSWPSLNSLVLYPHDATRVERSESHFRRFLRHIHASGVKSLYVVAHSMGSRLLVRSLQHPDAASLVPLLAETVFAAPDVDQHVFSRAVRFFRKRARRMTLYASSLDRALQVSRLFNGGPRAGDSGAHIIIASGLDTVDASAEARWHSLNHSAFGDSKLVLADLYELIPSGKRPPRMFLEARSFERRPYWALKK